MDSIKFEITLISATDLEEVVKKSSTKVYARVSIAGDPSTEKRTPADRHGNSNPAWNFTLKYTLSKFAVQQEGIMLVIKLYRKRRLGDRYIGEVFTSLKGLFDHGRTHGGGAMVSYPVKKGAVVSRGTLNFSYRFEEMANDEVSGLRDDSFQAGALRFLGGLLRSRFGIDVNIAR